MLVKAGSMAGMDNINKSARMGPREHNLIGDSSMRPSTCSGERSVNSERVEVASGLGQGSSEDWHSLSGGIDDWILVTLLMKDANSLARSEGWS